MAAQNVTQKLIAEHLVEGEMIPGQEIGIQIDQTLTQDATGTMVMLELEAMNFDRAKTELSAQYVDHNLLQEDYKNPEDHQFLQTACQRYGIWFSGPGNGVSHPVHQERFGKPGKTLLGSDSHTPAAGAIGMFAIGAGGLEVALAIAGYPFHFTMPKVTGVKLVGELPDWVSAKDVILEMLRRHGVKGGVNRVYEYYGPALSSLSVMDRHVIANMGTELGATSTVFPSDEAVKRFFQAQDRVNDWEEFLADEGAEYDEHEEIDLSQLEPLIAMPSSPDNVVPVREVAGEPIYQAYIGSSANPGYRDFAIAAEMVRGKTVHPRVSFDVNPTSRQILENLVQDKYLGALIHSGARIHQAGCNGCIGMGQAPVTGQLSLRTVPRNFPGRSGTKDDKVCLVSPETATASALKGEITDPRDLEMEHPKVREPEEPILNTAMLQEPPPPQEAERVKLEKGDNVVSLPNLMAPVSAIETPVLLKVGDHISTDEIMPAGARVLPFRSNIPTISEFVFEPVDPDYVSRVKELAANQGHAIVAGENYGQGSSREHAALAPRYLGLRVVIAKGFARIHWQNLINFGILPLTFSNPDDYVEIESSDVLHIYDLHTQLAAGPVVRIRNVTKETAIDCEHQISERQLEVFFAGGLINWVKATRNSEASVR